MVEEGDEDEQFKAVMDEAKEALQVPSSSISSKSSNWIKKLISESHPHLISGSGGGRR